LASDTLKDKILASDSLICTKPKYLKVHSMLDYSL
jgi:hypothetical protein